jgi:hypothetical protein
MKTLYSRKTNCNHKLIDEVWYKAWYNLSYLSNRDVLNHFFEVGIHCNHNPSPFVNTSWLSRNLETIEVKDIILNPCNFNQINTHPLVDSELQARFAKSQSERHHGSLNIDKWITDTKNIKHRMFLDIPTILSPLEVRDNTVEDFYPIAGNCLEYENKIIFDSGNWDINFIVNHLKYKPQSI